MVSPAKICLTREGEALVAMSMSAGGRCRNTSRTQPPTMNALKPRARNLQQQQING